MTDKETPPPAVAVSPGDQSSDRMQADADNTAAVEAQTRASSEREAAREQAATDQAVTNDRIDQLIAATEKQSATNEELALATVEYQERARLARRRFRVTIATLGVAIVVVVVGVFVMLTKLNASLDSGKTVRATLLDCVQPTGHCYQKGQRQTAKIVGTLNQVTTLAAACAPDYVSLPVNQRIVAIERCIQRGLHG